jgi:undecaprenyl-diphosphatase
LDLLSGFILGLVEGLTEFIPVSSTGHLILVGRLLGYEGVRASTFEIFIQLGAILSVVMLYQDRFWQLFNFEKTGGLAGWKGLGMLALTTFPALLLGAAAYSVIKERLFNPVIVAIGLGAGGLAILVIEARNPKPRKIGLDSLTWRDALYIGLFQCLALWPGVSRSAATIFGGMLIGLERKTSTEYSFLAAVPALSAAAAFDLLKSLPALQPNDTFLFGVGFLTAFIFAWIAIRFFLRLLNTHSLVPFGWYRIFVALLVLIFLR